MTRSISSEHSSDDRESDRNGSYSLSADVSESESSNNSSLSFGASTSSPPVTGKSDFPTTKDIVVWNQKKTDEDDVSINVSSEVDMMKERFGKLLLGEDMSGGGKGVCTALTISNAITNLSATVFGELWRLEPLASQKKAMWCREMEWLLCVSDYIVDLIPSTQQLPGGSSYEIMATRPRSDISMNLPALKKLDAMLLSMLDGFVDNEFWYVDRGIVIPGAENGASTFNGRQSIRQEEKWWLPYPKVPLNGLSEDARKNLQQCRDCCNQILKAAMAINSNVLAEMEIPSAYSDSLPKNGKACLGDIIYRYITAELFSPDCLLDCLDLSSEHHTLDIANRIEAAVHVWKKKERKKNSKHEKHRRSSWNGKVKGFVAYTEKSHSLAQRAETLLHSLRLRFPGLPQTALDMSKILYNKDVGQSILESYSRVMESLAFNIMARIDDVLYTDDAVKHCVAAESSMSLFTRNGLGGLPIQKRMSPSPFSVQHTPYVSPFATPTFFSSSPVNGSPHRIKKNSVKEAADFEKVWSYTGNLNSRMVSGNAPERN